MKLILEAKEFVSYSFSMEIELIYLHLLIQSINEFYLGSAALRNPTP